MNLAARWLLWAALLGGAAAMAAPPPVFTVQIDGAIGPATAEHVQRTFERAAKEQAQLIVVQMDTPGGLDRAMRDIIRAILASPVPVAAFVAPQGARAASAGTYILYASHIAAMAPATNLGAATPVAIGFPSPGGSERPRETASRPASSAGSHDDTMAAKRTNDAVAYIRSLAQLRGRDIAWAEQAVREAASLPANEALAKGVIDIVAADAVDLLRQVDGRTLTVAQGATVKLATRGAALVAIEPDWRAKLLAVISDPSLALLLMMLGIYGLMFEFMNPGFVLPGVAGGVCLLLALWGLQMLPINYAGLALILLGIAFFVAEVFVPSHGVLGTGGVASFALGMLLLVDTGIPGFGIPLSVVVGLTLVSAVLVMGIVAMAARARRRPVVSGAPLLVGALGEVIDTDGTQGWAHVAGERWRVRAGAPLQAGQRVRVVGVDGLTLDVQSIEEQGANP